MFGVGKELPGRANLAETTRWITLSRKGYKIQIHEQNVLAVLEQQSSKWQAQANLKETSPLNQMINEARSRLEKAVGEGIIRSYNKDPRKLDEGIFYFIVFANWSNEEELAQVAEELADRLADLRGQDIMILTAIKRDYEPRPESEPEA